MPSVAPTFTAPTSMSRLEGTDLSEQATIVRGLTYNQKTKEEKEEEADEGTDDKSGPSAIRNDSIEEGWTVDRITENLSARLFHLIGQSAANLSKSMSQSPNSMPITSYKASESLSQNRTRRNPLSGDKTDNAGSTQETGHLDNISAAAETAALQLISWNGRHLAKNLYLDIAQNPEYYQSNEEVDVTVRPEMITHDGTAHLRFVASVQGRPGQDHNEATSAYASLQTGQLSIPNQLFQDKMEMHKFHRTPPETSLGRPLSEDGDFGVYERKQYEALIARLDGEIVSEFPDTGKADPCVTHGTEEEKAGAGIGTNDLRSVMSHLRDLAKSWAADPTKPKTYIQSINLIA